MSAQPPRVTVLMSVHNGLPYLRGAIESILAQNFTDFEFLIIDDASTDETPEVLREYAAGDRRIRVVTNPENLGLTRSLNKGLELAAAPLVARQDADDLSLPERLARQTAFLDTHPEIALVTGLIEVIEPDGTVRGVGGEPLTPGEIAWGLHFHNVLVGHSLVTFRREAVQAVGGYDETFRYAQDFDLWQRLSARRPLAMLPEVLLRWRTHEKNLSTTRRAEQDGLALQALRGHLGRLLGRGIDEATARQLWHFWRREFVELRDPEPILAVLREAYGRFMAEWAGREPGIGQRVRRQTGERFDRWTARLNLRDAPRKKARVLLCSLRWSPESLLRHGIQTTRRRLFRW
jgi:hypothetical protein